MTSSEPSGRREDGALTRAFLEKRENLVLFLAARTRSMATAEDLVQELYVRLAALDPDQEVRSPSALLYRMAANLLIDHVRSAQRTARREGQWRMETRTILEGEESTGPAAEEVVLAKERARRLAEAVAELPPQMGRAFRLHKLEGLSQSETAEAMGVSRKMVEQHIQAAVRKLTERLRP